MEAIRRMSSIVTKTVGTDAQKEKTQQMRMDQNKASAIYEFVKAYNAANPNAPYRFSSNEERLQYARGESIRRGFT